MVHYIDKSKKPKRAKFYLAKPDKTIISHLKDVQGEDLVYNFDEVSTLSFTLPYYVERRHKQVINPALDQVKLKYRIRVIDGDVTTWFVIHKKPKAYSDESTISIEANSLEYELTSPKVTNLKEDGISLRSLMDIVLHNTGWKLGYVNPSLNLKYRSFDVSSQPVLDFLKDVAKSFESIVQYDTVKQTVNFYIEEEISPDRGFTFKEGQYINSLDDVEDLAGLVTRLHITGKDGLQINSVNPTGQPYIDDFSYFLAPFERDENRNVLKHSEHMSDALCHGILDYNEAVLKHDGQFKQFLDEKQALQNKKSEQQKQLAVLNTELSKAQDKIVAHDRGAEIYDRDELEKEFSASQKAVDDKKREITGLDNQIEILDLKIDELRKLLNYSTFMSPETLVELQQFIHHGEWSDESYYDPTDLYEAGYKELKEICAPAVDLSMSSVNFFNLITEQYAWDKVKLGDIVSVYSPKIRTNVKARISSMNPNYKNETFTLRISNGKRKLSFDEKFKNILYSVPKTKTDFNKRKINYEKLAKNFNSRNDRISTEPVAPTLPDRPITHVNNDDGSINLKFDWNYPTDYEVNQHNIDGFVVYIFASSTPTPYIFGSDYAGEQSVYLERTKRSFTFEGIPANKFYSLGVMAYRRVDPDISSDLIVTSTITQPSQYVEVSAQELSIHTLAASGMDISQAELETQTLGIPNENVAQTIYTPYRAEATVGIKGRLNNSYYIVQEDEPVPEYGMHWSIPSTGETKLWDGEKWNSIGAALGDRIDQIEKDLNDRIDDVEDNIRDDLNNIGDHIKDIEDAIDLLPDDIKDGILPDLEQIREDLLNQEKDLLDKIQEIRDLLEQDRLENEQVAKDILDNIAEIIEKNKQIEDYIADQISELIELNDQLKEQIDTEINDKVADLLDKINKHREELDANNGVIRSISAYLDEAKNQFTIIAEELSEQNEVLSEHSSRIEANERKLALKVEETEVRDIISDSDEVKDFQNRFSSIEMTARDIISSVGETNKRIDDEVEEYNKKLSTLTQTVDGFGFDIRSLTSVASEQGELIRSQQANIDFLLDEINLVLRSKTFDDFAKEYQENYSGIRLDLGNITTEVRDIRGAYSDVEDKLASVDERFSRVDQSIDSITSTVSSYKRDMDGNIESINSSIEQLADSIRSRVTSEELNTALNGRVPTSTYNQKMSEIEQSINGIRTTVGETNAKIDGIKFGARNYALGTAIPFERTIFNGDSNHTQTHYHVDPSISGDVIVHFDVEYINIQAASGSNPRITFQFVTTDPSGSNWRTAGIHYLPINGKHRVSQKFNLPNNLTAVRLSTRSDYVQSGKLIISNLMVEKGTRESDWSPSPQDMLDSVTEIRQNISTIEQTATSITQSVRSIETDITNINKDIRSVESKISQEANRIALEVSKREAGYVRDSLESHISSYNTKMELLDSAINARVTTTELNNVIANGDIYVRGTSMSRNANRILRVNGKQIYNAGGRGLRLTVLNRSNLSVHSDTTYDTYSNDTNRNNMATALNNLNDSYIVVISSYDAHATNHNLDIAIARCGGSGTRFTTSGNMHRVPFVLVGIPGIGTGAGLEVITTNAANAPYAEINTKVNNGVPYGINSNVSAVAQKASDALSEISIMKGQIESKVEKKTVETWREQDLKRISNAESRITQTESSIQNRVTLQEFNSAKDRITKAESQISQHADRITSTVQKVESGNHLVSMINQTATSITMRADRINLDGTALFGGTSTSFTRIQGDSFIAQGRYPRTWFGNTETNTVAFRVQDGYARFENFNKDRRLYYSDFGISTFIHGSEVEEGGPAGSGTIEFFSYMYDANVRGLSLYSNRGTIALRADTRDIILDAKRNIYLAHPRGGEITIVNGNVSDGNRNSDGVIALNNIKANTMRVNGGNNLYLAPANGYEVRVTSAAFYNNGSPNYRDFRAYSIHAERDIHAPNGWGRALRWVETSSILAKQNIRPTEVEGIHTIQKITIVDYNLNEDVKAGLYHETQTGVIAELSPEIAVDNGKSVDKGKLACITVKAVQEQQEIIDSQQKEIEKLNQDIKDLTYVVSTLISEIEEIK
ncbi:phage tail spike protein [Shouchella clausii]|uniref:phage tail spike protein n=1 Tax=Shouchella clausii TaxID=79880 RepID=UPI001C72AAF0|nr:phage tail spike protein [Shouchella clausii]MBX0320210.1 hypothetical protein [Shouchella clausii]